MRTVEFEHLRPGEILEEQARKSIAYLPIGPLEWHGPAMPYGSDPMVAHYVAVELAKQTGGVVMPTLFCGTERERSPETLDAMGFEDTAQYIVGQDFPSNGMKSFYSKEDVFCLVLREFLRMLIMQKYKLIVIINGHGAENQSYAVNRLCVELSNETESKIISVSSFILPDGVVPEVGHGNCVECSTLMYLTDDVDLSTYPPEEKKLKSCEWGINDLFTYLHQPNEDKTVQGDPRTASKEIGKYYLDAAIQMGIKTVEEEYARL